MIQIIIRKEHINGHWIHESDETLQFGGNYRIKPQPEFFLQVCKIQKIDAIKC